MTQFDLTPEQERKLYDELAEAEQRTRGYQSKMSPQLAANIGQLYRNNTYGNPGVILAAGNAVTAGAMDFDQANALILNSSKNDFARSVEPKEDKNKSFLERNVWSKVRTASRWTFAGLNFIPQAVTNLASQPFTENPDGFKGFFLSTDIGTLLENDNVAGDGWFMGGRAAQLQAERAREFRGEIGGRAWTFGRGAASLITQPGSREYNILSGLVDATAAIVIPAAPGATQAKTAASVLGGKAGLRTLAGLADVETGLIDVSKVSTFLNSRGGESIVKRIAKVEDIDEALTLFPGVQDMEFINKVVDLKDASEVRNYLEKTLGRAGPTSTNQINISRRADVTRAIVGRESMIARLMETVPGGHVVISGGNARDVARSVRNMNQYLKAARVDRTERIRLVKNFSDALVAADYSAFDAVKEIQDTTRAALRAQGVPEQAIDDLMSTVRQFVDEQDVYGGVSNLGTPTAYDRKVITTDGQVGNANAATPGLISETLKQTQMILPDYRRVRRMTSGFGWIYGKGMARKGDAREIGFLRNEVTKLQNELKTVSDPGVTGPLQDRIRNLKTQIADLSGPKLKNPAKYGNLRMPLAALESFQNEIWRPITLMTGGYVIRNMTDSAFRYTMAPGLRGGVFHPIQWLNIAMFKRYQGTLTGEDFAKTAETWLEDTSREYFEAVGQGIREGYDPVDVARFGAVQKHFGLATRTSGGRYKNGLRTEINLIYDDAVARQVAQGLTPEQIFDEFFQTDAGKQYARQLQRLNANRTMVSVNDPNVKVTGTAEFIGPNGTYSDINRQNILEHIYAQGERRLNEVTGGNVVLKEAAGTGKFTDQNGQIQDVFQYNEAGKPIGYTDEWEAELSRIIREDNDLIARGEKGTLKDWYKYKVELDVARGTIDGQTSNVIRGWNKVVDYFFSSLYPKRSSYLMQSPAFRQYYYKAVDNLLDELNQDAVTEIRNALQKAAGNENFNKGWLSRYVGDSKTDMALGKGLGSRLYDKLSNPQAATGRLNLEEIDSYAKGFALDETKNLFYNASEKSNFADILRVVSPFGSAWAEVMRSWGQIAFSNPENLKRIGVSVQGVRNMDPDGDGKGFFYRDPTTGEYVFNYPFSEQIGGLAAGLGLVGAAGLGVAFGVPGIIGGLAAGVGGGALLQQKTGLDAAMLAAPAKSLSMGFNIYPGIGPVAQISASKLLGKVPQADQIRDVLLPYGEPEMATIGPIPLPSWAGKVVAAIQDPDNNRLLGDLVIDTMRVLRANGDYDLSQESEKQRLEEDATSRARILLILRGLGQFVGPTRPELEFRVETYQGDMYTAELAKAFRQMQLENYDTAVERFVDTFGENAFLYIQSKSRATAGGLDASEEFGKFERENGDLFAQYGDVAGYIAPTGTTFDFQVYQRQLQTGTREKLKPSEFLDAAQATIGKALYRSSVRSAGPNPTNEQEDQLRIIRQYLYDTFPGFQKEPVDYKKQETNIARLEEMAFSGLADDNPVVQGLKIYFDARNQALAEAKSRYGEKTTLAGKKVNDLRSWLRTVGDQIIAQYPEFERVYDRVLFNEIDIDTTGSSR